MGPRHAILFAAAVTVCAALSGGLLRLVVPLHSRQRHHEVGIAVFLQLGVIFAVLLAFLFNEVLSGYGVAAEAVNMECSQLHDAALLSTALPPPLRAEMERDILAYVGTVINVEWPDMQRRTISMEALRAFQTMLGAATGIEAATPHEAMLQSKVLDALNTVHLQRETRLFQMTQAIPPPVWLLLLLLSATLVGFVLLAGVESVVAHILFSALFTGGIAFLLVLVRLLDFPFEGPLRLPPDDFQRIMDYLLVLSGSR